MGHSLTSKMQLNAYGSPPSIFECCVIMAQMFRLQKKAKENHFSTITISHLHSRQGDYKPENLRRLKILLDTGCGATLIHHSLVGKLKQKNKPLNWSTKAGGFKTTKICKISFTLSVFHEYQNICWKAYVDSTDKLTSRSP